MTVEQRQRSAEYGMTLGLAQQKVRKLSEIHDVKLQHALHNKKHTTSFRGDYTSQAHLSRTCVQRDTPTVMDALVSCFYEPEGR